MQFSNQCSALIAALALGVVSAPAGAAVVLDSGCDGNGACEGVVSADQMLEDALTLADGDEFGAPLLTSSRAPSAGAVFSESALGDTATLADSSTRGPVARMLATIVPEPASFLLLVSGLLAFAYARSRPMTERQSTPSR